MALLNARNWLVCGLMSATGCPKRHVVERDRRALVRRPIGAFLQGDLVDSGTHPRKRERQCAREVAGIEAPAVHGGAAGAAGIEDASAIGRVDARRMKLESRCGNVLSARQKAADVVDALAAGGVQHAVCLQLKHRIDVGGGGNPDGSTPGQYPDVLAGFGIGVDARTDDP